jgi:hypothetical protein
VSIGSGISLSPFRIVSLMLSPARGPIAPIGSRPSGQGGRRSVGKLLVLTQTIFQLLNQLRKPRRSRRIGRPNRESAALFQLPFELFSIRLLILDGTRSFSKANRSTTRKRLPFKDLTEAIARNSRRVAFDDICKRAVVAPRSLICLKCPLAISDLHPGDSHGR